VRILHVVTMVSPDGAFGGPARVTANLAVGLAGRGHEVLVAAGHLGYGAAGPPSDLDGAPARLFPLRRISKAAGVSGLVSPSLLRWARAALAQVDLVHVHLARDLVTLPVAALAVRRGVPLVLQPHGMVVPSTHPLSTPLDAVLTRRVLRSAAAVLHLTRAEQEGLSAVARGPIALRRLGNGVPCAADTPAPSGRPELLFCARLQQRKRPLLFVRAAARLLHEGVDASFVLVGPDGGEGSAVRAAVAKVGDPDRLRWEGALTPAQTLSRMARASALVLPSVNEPYPMSVLEAMSVGRSVLVTQSCGLADAVRTHDCGVVVDESLEGLVAGMQQLVVDAEGLARRSGNAVCTARGLFGMESVTDRLEQIYQAVARM